MKFEIVKAKEWYRGPYIVIEEGYRIFEGNEYQCEIYIKDRKNGFSIEDSTFDAKRRTCRPYKTVKIYLD